MSRVILELIHFPNSSTHDTILIDTILVVAKYSRRLFYRDFRSLGKKYQGNYFHVIFYCKTSYYLVYICYPQSILMFYVKNNIEKVQIYTSLFFISGNVMLRDVISYTIVRYV